MKLSRIPTSAPWRGRVDLEGGEAVMIPAGVAHEFWNPFDEPFRGFMLAFGEGA